MRGSATPTSATKPSSSPTAMPTSPRRSAWNSTPPATASASALIATRCWWMTAWSRSSISSRPPARSRSPAAIRCWGSSETDCRQTATLTTVIARLGRATPYAAAVRFYRKRLWNTGSPAFADDDGGVRLPLQPCHRDAVACQLIGALVCIVAGMALDPVPAHLMRLQRGVEALPQFDVLDRLLVGGAPAVPLPAMDPAGDALTHILAVGVEIDGAGFLQRLQRRDRGHQLHAVVGGMGFTALQFLFAIAEVQDRAPAAGAGISRPRPVRVDDDGGKRTHATSPEAATP